MEEVFVIDGESHNDVKQQLTDARERMLKIKKDHHLDMESNGGAIEVMTSATAAATAVTATGISSFVV